MNTNRTFSSTLLVSLSLFFLTSFTIPAFGFEGNGEEVFVTGNLERNYPASTIVNGDEVIYRITFDQPVSNVDPSDFILKSGLGFAKGQITEVIDLCDGQKFDLRIKGVTGSNVKLDVDLNPAHNIAGINGARLKHWFGSEEHYWVDQKAPTFTTKTQMEFFSKQDFAVRTHAFDDNIVSYTISGGKDSEAFSIGFGTGILRLNDGEVQKDKERYTVEIAAFDGINTTYKVLKLRFNSAKSQYRIQVLDR